jgi:gliding motility-associated-like protein
MKTDFIFRFLFVSNKLKRFILIYLTLVYASLDVYGEGPHTFNHDASQTNWTRILKTQCSCGTFFRISAFDGNNLFITTRDSVSERMYDGFDQMTTTLSRYYWNNDDKGFRLNDWILSSVSCKESINYYSQVFAGPYLCGSHSKDPFLIKRAKVFSGTNDIDYKLESATTGSINREVDRGIFYTGGGFLSMNNLIRGRLLSSGKSMNTGYFRNPLFGSFLNFVTKKTSANTDIEVIISHEFRISGNDNVTFTNGSTQQEEFIITDESDLKLHTGPTVICTGDFTTIWVDSIRGATYQWYYNNFALNGATSNSFTTPAAGSYHVIVTTINGTFTSDSVEIKVKSVDNATISNNQIIHPPQLVQLHASGGTSYDWKPTTCMMNPHSAHPIVAPKTTTTYTVEVTNEWNCKTILSVTVAVACDTLYNSNGFALNKNVVGDGFVIDNIDKYPGNKLWVYNRWGNLVFKAVDYNNKWDGVSNVSGFYMGKKLPVGTYYFIMDLNDNGKSHSGYLLFAGKD